MTRTLRLLAIATAMTVAPFAVSQASAQQPVLPTPAGTIITNTATVNYSDANGNTYTATSAPISVTVVFKAGIDVTGSASLTPASPSTNNTATFTLTNTGNAVDKYSVAITAPGLTNLSYDYGSSTGLTLAQLNTALAAVNVAAPTLATPTTSSITVTVHYDVPDALGGSTLPITFTATSLGDNTATDTQVTNVIPPVAGTVTVNALSPISTNNLPSGTAHVQYTALFEVRNDANLQRTFALTTALSVPADGTIISVTGASVSGGNITLAANTIGNVTVTYEVANVSAGSTFDVSLTATTASAPASTAAHHVTVVKPLLTITKVAYDPTRTTALASSGAQVKPGDIVWYKVSISNVGSANAASVQIVDALNNQLAYVTNETDGSDWTVTTATSGTTSAVTVTAALTGTLPFAPTTGSDRYIWIKTTVR